VSDGSRPSSPQRVPTLTEVVQLAPLQPFAMPTTAEAALVGDPPLPPLDEAQVVQRVLHDVQRQIDLLLEYRLREALGPVLARLGDALIHDARDELASTLRDVVAKAVAQELARQRGR
jgi:hypothetical protein